MDRIGEVLLDEPAQDDAITVTLTGAATGASDPSPSGPRLGARSSPPRICPRRSPGVARPRRTCCASPRMPSSTSRPSIAIHGNGGRAHAHLVIEAMPNSHATIVLRHDGSAQLAQNVEIIVRDGAHLTLISVQQWDDEAVHAASHQARVDRDATLRHFVVSFGGGVVRVNPSVELAGAGAQGQLYGLSYSDAGQHLESQVYLFHKGARHARRRALQGCAAGRRRAQRLDRRRADRAGCGRHRLVRGQPQPGPHRRRACRVDPEPRDRDRRHPRRRPRQRHRPLRRRAAVLPPVARHQRRRGASTRGRRLPERHRAADRHPRAGVRAARGHPGRASRDRRRPEGAAQ